MRIIGAHRVPAFLKIPIVLENVADHFLLVGQDGQKVHHKHRIPEPLAVEGIPGASQQPAAFEDAFRRLDLSEDALPEHILRQTKKLRIF